MKSKGVPLVRFLCSLAKSLSRCPQMMSSGIWMLWEAGTGKAVLSGQENAWH